MGATMTSLLWRCGLVEVMCARNVFKVVIVGLESSGKTSVLYRLRLGTDEALTPLPTSAFNFETVEYKNYRLLVHDVAGKFPQLWKHYCDGVEGLVFVVDSADVARLGEARRTLQGLLASGGGSGGGSGEPSALRRAAVVVLANKQDLPSALPPAEVAKALELPTLVPSPRQCVVIGSSAARGEGLWEAVEWLVKNMRPCSIA